MTSTSSRPWITSTGSSDSERQRTTCAVGPENAPTNRRGEALARVLVGSTVSESMPYALTAPPSVPVARARLLHLVTASSSLVLTAHALLSRPALSPDTSFPRFRL